MKYALTTLTSKEVEIREEILRLEKLEGHPNEELRQSSLKNNKRKLDEILDAKLLISLNMGDMGYPELTK